MARENLQITITAVDKASGVFKGMSSSIGSIDKQVQGLNESARNLNFMFLGQDLLRAARTGATGLYGLAKASSDVAEAQNFVNQIFGESTDTITKFAKTSTAATLMSEKQILDASATFGVFGKSAGIAGEDLAGFSKNLVLLAADMASIKNVPVDQAINAIGAAFRNEHTPIRQFGAALDEATLKAKALELGIYDGTGTLTTQQRVLATNQLLYEQLGFAIGDVGRTFGEVANQSRYTQAQFENFKASVGESLTPMFSNLMSVAQSAMNVFMGLPAPLKDFATNAAAAGTAALALGGGIVYAFGKIGQGVQAWRDLSASMRAWQAQGGRTAGAIVGIGKALGGIGLAAAASNMVFDFLNDMHDMAGKTADAIDKVGIALAKTDSAGAVQAFSELAKAQDDTLKFSHLWEDFGDSLQVGLGGAIVPIEDLDNAFQKLLDSAGPEAAGQMLNALNMQAQGLDKNSRAYKDAVEIINRYTPKVELATQAMQASGQESGLSAEQIAQYGDAALGAAEDTTELSEGAKKAAEQMQEWRDSLARVEGSITPLSDKIESFSDSIEGAFGTNEWLDNVIEIADGVQELAEGLKDSDGAALKGADSLDVFTEAGRDQLKTIDKMAETVGKDMVRAYEESGGSVDAARENMLKWREEIGKQMKDAGVAQPVIDKYLEALNLTEGTFESVIKLTNQEEARRKLDELNIEYQKLPPIIYTQVQAAIDRGDYEAAYGIMKDFLEEPVETPVETTGGPEAAADTHGRMGQIFDDPLGQPVVAEDENSREMKGYLRSVFGPTVMQPVTSNDSNSGALKQGIAGVFSWPVNQPIRSNDINSASERSAINSRFTSAINQIITTKNDDANRTKDSIWSVFRNPITQTVQVTTSRSGAGSGGGTQKPQMAGVAAAPSQAEYAATSMSGVTATATLGAPAPVTAGAVAPIGTPSITNLNVYMPAGVNEVRVVDALRNYARTNGRVSTRAGV